MKKREIIMYSILEFAKLEKRLEQRAAEGWMLKKAGFIWTYEKSVPKKVHFSIVFFPKTNALEPEPSDSLVMMREFCEKTGWKLVSEIGQMQIFCNEAENPVPIETEAWIQVKNIHETAKANIISPYTILLVNSILQLALQVMQFMTNPINWLGMGYNFYLVLCWIVLGVGCGTELVYSYAWYKKAKRIAEEEDTLYLPKSLNAFRITYLGVAMVSLLLSILALANYTTSKYGLLVIVWTVVIVGVPMGISRLLKKMKVSAKWNRIIIVVMVIVCTLGMTIGLVASIIKDEEHIFRKGEKMALQLSDLREVDEERLSGSSRRSNSIFLSFEEGYQSERLEEGEDITERSNIDYTILVIKAPFIYDFCKDELLKKYDYLYEDDPFIGERGYRKVNMTQWGALEVYRYYDYEGEEENNYIVCYEDRILQIDFGWVLNDGEIEKMSEIIQNMK